MIGILILTLTLTFTAVSYTEYAAPAPIHKKKAMHSTGTLPNAYVKQPDNTQAKHQDKHQDKDQSRHTIQKLPTATIRLAGHQFTVELAYTRQSRDTGLMYRKELAANHGMLFIFSQPGYRSFYMKNCLIDIDIAFIDSYGRIINTTTMRKPRTGQPLRYYSSFAPAKYALEVPAGTIRRLHIIPGMQVQIPAKVRFIKAQAD